MWHDCWQHNAFVPLGLLYLQYLEEAKRAGYREQKEEKKEKVLWILPEIVWKVNMNWSRVSAIQEESFPFNALFYSHDSRSSETFFISSIYYPYQSVDNPWVAL